MKNLFEPTADQMKALKLIRPLLAEKHYLVADVSDRYRRHTSDFVVIPKDNMIDFAIVRAAPTCIVVRPFRQMKDKIYRELPAIRKQTTVPIKWMRPRLSDPRTDTPWLDYSVPEAHDEIIRFGLALAYEHA